MPMLPTRKKVLSPVAAQFVADTGIDVQPARDTRTIIIAGTGESLTQADVELAIASGLDIMAIGDNYQRFPNAQMLYACDYRWWNHHHAAVVNAAFSGELLTIDPSAKAKFDDLTLIPCVDWHVPLGGGLSGVPNAITGGYSSGHQAVHEAYNRGYKRALLLGFDMQGGHWFGSHPQGMNTPSDFGSHIAAMEKLARDLGDKMEVINCSPSTALTCFAREKLSDVI